jgi:hypothetical protein
MLKTNISYIQKQRDLKVSLLLLLLVVVVVLTIFRKFIFLGPRANTGMVPVHLFQVATTCFPCSPPQLNLE